MEMAMDWARYGWEHYQAALESKDSRVAGWPMMDGFGPSLGMVILYLLVAKLGPRVMENRNAVHMPRVLVIYNFAMVLLNFHIAYELLVCSTKLGYSYSCQLVHYGDDPDELRIAAALWWYYFSKFIELMDTVFFILRKKSSHLTFLHVYHHASMCLFWWTAVRWYAGGSAFFAPMLNAGVHVLMYFYYGVAALGPRFQKFLYWKKYLTTIQMTQFVLILIHIIQSLYVDCKFPHWAQYLYVFYCSTFFALFSMFYVQAYKDKPHGNKNPENGFVKSAFTKLATCGH